MLLLRRLLHLLLLRPLLLHLLRLSDRTRDVVCEYTDKSTACVCCTVCSLFCSYLV
jgi:hypothetical protein